MDPHGRIASKLPLKIRRNAYTEKMIAVANGKSVTLYPADFLQYILERQSITPEDFSCHIGRDGDYFRSNLFNCGYNDGGSPLPKPVRDMLTELTGKPPVFWLRRSFRSEEAEGLQLDMEKDISALIARHANAGGKHTRALNREALLDAHYKGL